MKRVLLLCLTLINEMMGIDAFCRCFAYDLLIVNAENVQLTVSSAQSSNYIAKHSKWTAEYGWCSLHHTDAWIQVDLRTNKLIEGVVTWGNVQQGPHVRSFRLKYRSDGSSTWMDYTESNGNIKVITQL
ncbi:hypothetical protein CAPTEDRAFT_198322 [Capitella teleta]|uniref:F5/8 type C domain-containing protein n=1 Tax=Capitella teleta TaxID=283909 RepID=R7U9U8_CAPTE|nr:hypothetical protein CAPTEDRAFT_198322 [Capitella teleta]|eukprot:ELU03135.1 hypothetical protein CAPTEDRAFT_198322 [Capitella teleta]